MKRPKCDLSAENINEQKELFCGVLCGDLIDFSLGTNGRKGVVAGFLGLILTTVVHFVAV